MTAFLTILGVIALCVFTVLVLGLAPPPSPYGKTQVIEGELPDDFVPPTASLGPVGRGHVLVSTAMIPPPFDEPPPPPDMRRHSTCPNCDPS